MDVTPAVNDLLREMNHPCWAVASLFLGDHLWTATLVMKEG